MQGLVTVYIFSYPTEMSIVKAKMEAEGISCWVKDEMTVQVHNFYSNAIGGIKLMVKAQDVEAAREILAEAGYIGEQTETVSPFWLKFNAFSDQIVLLNKLNPIYRLLLLSVFVACLILVSIASFGRASTLELLLERNWCVAGVEYQGKGFNPNTIEGIKLSGDWFCEEAITIRRNGTLRLPGFKSSAANGTWTLKDDSLIITEIDNFKHVYQGSYKVDVDEQELVLKSPTTTIFCYRK